MRLKDKRVIITGAASGIGRAGALLFASEGASVVAVDRDGPGLDELCRDIAAARGRAYRLEADLCIPEEACRIVHEGARLVSGIDVLWCNAGMNGPPGIENLDMQRYEATVALNLTSTVSSCGEAIPLMRSKGGSIVLTSSNAGLVGSVQSPVYTATKFAIVGLAKSLALKYAKDAIRVNAICPGPCETPMIDDAFARSPGHREFVMSSIPLGRLGLPGEVAEAALWLGSDYSSFVTGIALPVDGGWTAR